jgi:hypothetical protein
VISVVICPNEPTTSIEILVKSPLELWPDWYLNPNPFKVALKAYERLLPVFITAGVAYTAVILLIAIFADPTQGFGNNLYEIVGSLFLVLIYFGVCGCVTAIVGLFAVLAVTVFDQSMGKQISPSTFGAASVGMSLIPLAILGIFQHAFSIYPDSNWFVYFYFVGSVLLGSALGIWGVNRRFGRKPEVSSHRFTFSTRQLLVLTAWICGGLASGFGGLILPIGTACYVLTVAGVVTTYRKFLTKIYRLES